MYHHCTTEKTATQQRIFYEALYEAMQDRLYSEITITELCNQTGLSRNIFYRLFDCKDDVLYACLDNLFYECSNHMHTNSIREQFRLVFTFWKDHKIMLDILQKNRLESLLAIRAVICCCRIDFGMHKFVDTSWNDYSLEILSFYINGFIGLLFHWYHNDFNRTVDEMCDIATYVLLHPPIHKE